MSSAQDQPGSGTGAGATTSDTGMGGTTGGTGMGATVGRHASPTAEATRGYVPRPAPGYDDQTDFASGGGPSGAVVGWTVFAAVILMISGIGNILEGIAQLVRGAYFTTLPNYAYNLSVHSWGWIHLIAASWSSWSAPPCWRTRPGPARSGSPSRPSACS